MMFSIEEDPVRSPLREMVSSSILEVIRRKDYAATRTLVCGDKLSADDCSWCLMAACDVGWNEGIELLLENGAGTNAKTESGNTCLHFAAKSNCSSSCIRALIENGADPRAVNVGRNTPLLFAASSGAPRALETLVPYSSIDATERAGITALSATCLFAVNSPDDPNFRECLVLLLRAGANPAVRDHKGRTPLDILRSSARNGVIETMAADLRNRLDELEREAERQAADLIRDEQRLKTKTRGTARKIVRKQTIVGNNSSAENISPRSSRREDRGEDMVERDDADAKADLVPDDSEVASEAEVSQEDLGIVEKPPASGSCDQSGAVLELSSQNDEDVVGDKEEEMNPQRLFESLYPESIPVVLTLKDLLMPSPSLSGAQLETLHDILDKCLRKVVESRIILAVDREREAICAHKNY